MSEESGSGQGKKKWKLGSELKEYWAVSTYFAAYLLSLATYRKLVLAEYHIGYYEYGAALVQALILGKIVLIGKFLRLGDKAFEGRPLIVKAIWKSLAFSAFAVALIALEHVVKALIHHQPILSEFHASGGKGFEALARLQLMLVAFVPFFAYGEIAHALGEQKLNRMLFGVGPKDPGGGKDGPGGA